MARESRFTKLAQKISHEYREKGYSRTLALEIGRATAAKVGYRKYGKKGMERRAKRGRRTR